MSDLPEITPEVAAVIRRYLESGGTWPPLQALATGIANTQPGTSPSGPTAGSNVFGSLSGGHAMLPSREAVDEFLATAPPAYTHPIQRAMADVILDPFREMYRHGHDLIYPPGS